jgi:hypothetical protein
MKKNNIPKKYFSKNKKINIFNKIKFNVRKLFILIMYFLKYIKVKNKLRKSLLQRKNNL